MDDGGVCGQLWWYKGLEDVVESGGMEVAELEKFSFIRFLRMSGGARSSGRRMSGGARSSGAWANSGT